MIKIKNHCILSTGIQLVYMNGQCDAESFLKVDVSYNVLKVSKYKFCSGPYFPTLGLKLEINSVNLHIQSEYRKIRTRKNPRIWTLFTQWHTKIFHDPHNDLTVLAEYEFETWM